MSHPKIISPSRYLQFITGGDALFTIKSERSGTHFTFKVEKSKKDRNGYLFVKALTGSDNEHSYSYLGYLKPHNSGYEYIHGTKSKIGSNAPVNKAFEFVFKLAQNKQAHPQLILWHHGRCCVCGRTLTDPISIELGIGPICRGK